MALSLEELTTPLTVDEVRTSIYNVLAAVGVSTTNWKPGAVVRTLISAVSIVLAALSRLMAAIAKSGFLDTAEADWLTLVAYYVYGVTRIAATAATGEVTLTNSGGGVYSGDPGDLIFLNTATGKTYRNSEAYSLGAMSSTTVAVEAIEVGTDSNALIGEIDDLVTPLIGVTVTNAAPALGTDEEADPALRIRCKEKLAALSPDGPTDAYAFIAKSAVRADGSLIGVTRVRTVSDGEGHITVTVGTATGGVTGDEDDPDTDLGAIALAIRTQCIPTGNSATVQSATANTIAVTYSAWAYTTVGLSNAQLEAAIEIKLAEMMSTEPIGGNVIGTDPGKIFADAIRTVIGATKPEIFHVLLTLPAGDVTMADDDLPVLGTVTSTITQVSPP